MQYTITRDVYMRQDSYSKCSKFEAKNDKVALAIVMEECMYGAPEKEEYDEMSVEDLTEAIGCQNGDGCDYIYSILREDNSVLFEGGEYSREDELENWPTCEEELYDDDED